MQQKVVFFYRHPFPIYFSIEKLFSQIARTIGEIGHQRLAITEIELPFLSKPRHIFHNIRFAKKNQADINHVTGDVHYLMLGLSKKNLNVLTIHDCVVLHRYPKNSLRFWAIKKLWYDWPVRKADVVAVISEATRQDLLRFTNCNPEKIRVVTNFIDPSFHHSDYIFHASCPRILFVGTTENKNLGRFAEAMTGLSAVLDIVGPLSQAQIALLSEHRIRYEQSAGLTTRELQEKYHRCDLVAFPTTYEGFGLPIIEAQAVGRPVLTSNLSPMGEVAGGAACLVDPYEPVSIREGLLRLISDPSYRENLISRGLENVKRYSLENISRQYMSLYEEFSLKKSQSIN